MKPLAKVVAYVLFVCGLVVFLVLPGNKYGWMKEMDPSLAMIPVDETSGNRAIFAFLLMVVIAASQLAIAIKTANRTERLVSIALAFVAISAWFLRFGG